MQCTKDSGIPVPPLIVPYNSEMYFDTIKKKFFTSHKQDINLQVMIWRILESGQ